MKFTLTKSVLGSYVVNAETVTASMSRTTAETTTQSLSKNATETSNTTSKERVFYCFVLHVIFFRRSQIIITFKILFLLYPQFIYMPTN